jgi:cysteine-rich repeat protein
LGRTLGLAEHGKKSLEMGSFRAGARLAEEGAHTMHRSLRISLLHTSLFSLLLACACGGSPGHGDDATPEVKVRKPGGGSEVTQPAKDSEPTNDAPQGLGSVLSDNEAAQNEGGAAGDDEEAPEGSAGADGVGAEEPIPDAGYCGDGVVQSAEWCDDGNATRGDGCNPDCKLSGRSLDNAIEVLPYDQELNDLVLIGDQLYAVGFSAEDADLSFKDKLVVKADLAATIIEPVSLSEGATGKSEELHRITTDGDSLYTAGHAEDAHQDPLALFERRGLNLGFQWDRTIQGSGAIGGEGTGIAVVGSGLQAIGHLSIKDEGRDILLTSLSKSNGKAPVTSFLSGVGSNDDYGSDIVSDGTGSISAGVIYTTVSERQVWVRRSDASGTPLWTKNHQSSASVHRIASAPDGKVALAGSIGGNGNGDAWVTLLDADGSLLWSKSFDYGQHDWATGVTFDPENGDLIVVGSFEKYSWDIFVQRLSQAGEERWFSELDGYGFDDYANAVTLDEHGAIWAVGSWGREGEDSDYWIGKFSP